MIAMDRKVRNLLLIGTPVIVTIVYLSYYRNSVQQNVQTIVDNKAVYKVKQGKSAAAKNVMINCRGKEQRIIKNIFSRDNKGWYENRKLCDSCFDFPKATLKTTYGQTPIFIYLRDQDVWVSTSLQDRGTFESDKSAIIFKMMKEDPELNIIDIGANIGMFVFVYLLVFFSSHSRIFAHGDVTITGEGMQILTDARHIWPLNSEGSFACHTCCDTGHPFIMVISENP